MGLEKMLAFIYLLVAYNSVYGEVSTDKRGNSSEFNSVTPIAFSAITTLNQDYIAGNTVVYDRIIINEGGRYFDNSGQFGCLDDDVGDARGDRMPREIGRAERKLGLAILL